MQQKESIFIPSANQQNKDPQACNQPIPQHRTPSNQHKITKQEIKVVRLKLVSKTWNKDSYGLFDYQSQEQQYQKKIAYLEDNTFIVRNNNSCQTLFIKDPAELEKIKFQRQFNAKHSASSESKEDFTILGELLVEKFRKSPSFKLKLFKPVSETANQTQFHTLHSYNKKRLIPFIFAESPTLKSSGISLHPGSLVKFGRVEYLVLESFNGKTTQSYRDSVYLDQGNNIFDVLKHRELNTRHQNLTSEEKENINCKICLMNQQTKQDPLISPCKCKGYCGLIHIECLRTWINNKVKKEDSTTGKATSYNFTKFQCEICKAPFPKLIRTEIDDVQMMKIYKPSKPYIMLQSLDPLNNILLNHNTNNSCDKEKLLHVIAAQDKYPIRIGRANDCQIRLTDISVSRKHAQIKLVDGQFYIRDTGAKFGTLVQWDAVGSGNKREIILINRKKALKIQLGRTLYEFSVEDINQDIDTQ